MGPRSGVLPEVRASEPVCGKWKKEFAGFAQVSSLSFHVESVQFELKLWFLSFKYISLYNLELYIEQTQLLNFILKKISFFPTHITCFWIIVRTEVGLEPVPSLWEMSQTKQAHTIGAGRELQRCEVRASAGPSVRIHGGRVTRRLLFSHCVSCAARPWTLCQC